MLGVEHQKKDTPHFVRNGGCNTLATSYFHRPYRPTIIGATVFHFRVRNGNGWGHCAMITRWGSARRVLPGSVDPGFRFPGNCIQGCNKFVFRARQGPSWKWNDVRQTDD